MSTAAAPQAATMIWAVADQRSRKIESETIAAPFGLFSSTRIANTNPATKPAPQMKADAARLLDLGQKTATIISRPAAASIESDGESANQSTWGLWITEPPPGSSSGYPCRTSGR